MWRTSDGREGPDERYSRARLRVISSERAPVAAQPGECDVPRGEADFLTSSKRACYLLGTRR